MIVNYYETLKWLRQSAKTCSMMDIDCANCAGDDCEGHEQIVFLEAADAVMNLLSFALEMAHLAIDLPDDDDCISAEVVLRKLNKIGIVRKEGDLWVYDRERVTDNETTQA